MTVASARRIATLAVVCAVPGFVAPFIAGAVPAWVVRAMLFSAAGALVVGVVALAVVLRASGAPRRRTLAAAAVAVVAVVAALWMVEVWSLELADSEQAGPGAPLGLLLGSTGLAFTAAGAAGALGTSAALARIRMHPASHAPVVLVGGVAGLVLTPALGLPPAALPLSLVALAGTAVPGLIGSAPVAPPRGLTRASGLLLGGTALLVVAIAWVVGGGAAILLTGRPEATPAVGLAAAGAQLAAIPLVLALDRLLPPRRPRSLVAVPVVGVLAGVACWLADDGSGGSSIFAGAAVAGGSIGGWAALRATTRLPVTVTLLGAAAGSAVWTMSVLGTGGIVFVIPAILLMVSRRASRRAMPAASA